MQDEMLAEENWGGLVVPKKRKRRSYLQKSSEWLHIDLQQKANVLPIGILRNGNCAQLKPVKLNKTKYILTNTCAFDSLMQTLCSNFCDSENFSRKIKSKTNEMLQLVQQMIKSINVKAYRLRCAILMKVCNDRKILPNGMVHISTQTTMEGAIRKLALLGEIDYSYIERICCFKRLNVRIISQNLIPLLIDGEDLDIQTSLDNYFSARQLSKGCARKD